MNSSRSPLAPSTSRFPARVRTSLFLALPLALSACSSSKPAPEPAPPAAPAVELTSTEVSGTPAGADANGFPKPVYASHEELESLYKDEITAENLEAILDQIEAEILAETPPVDDGTPD